MSENSHQPLAPDPALKQLDRFVGDWTMEGNLVGSAAKNIIGRTSYRWLPGGFFLEQHVQLDFAGFAQIDSLELIRYDPDTNTFPSQVYSNMSPQVLPYTWALDGDRLTITVSYGPLDATFTAEFSADGDSLSGGWRANPGADENINVAYDIGGHRVK